MIHISELAPGRVGEVTDVVQVGDEIDIKVMLVPDLKHGFETIRILPYRLTRLSQIPKTAKNKPVFVMIRSPGIPVCAINQH